MPNREHYTGGNPALLQGHHGFGNNPQAASTAGPSHLPHHHHPVMNQQQPHHPGSVYPHHTQPVAQAPYQQSGNFSYANQPLQMPTAPSDRRYAHHSEVASAQPSQPQFSQTRYSETYPQYGYPTGNMQPAYATAYPPGGYPQPGSTISTADRQQEYVNGTYPPVGSHSGHPQYPPQGHNSDQMSRVADMPGAYSRNAAGTQAQSQLSGVSRNANRQTEPSRSSLPTAVAYQQPRDTQQQRESSADRTSRQLKNSANSDHVNHTQQNKPHIVKSAILNPEAVGKFLYVPSLTVTLHF